MSRKRLLSAFACAIAALALTSAAVATAAPTPLLVSQSTAFSFLGHSCGGIQEQVYATGFDSATGDPTGDAYLQTHCGGSGRGGGYHTTAYAAWVSVVWDFSGAEISTSALAGSPSVDAGFSATDPNGDEVYNSAGTAYLLVTAPGAPTAVTATQNGDQFQVGWTPGVTNPAVITSSTITATAVGSGATVSATVSGSAASGLVGPLDPNTTYEVTVTSTDAGGSGPASGAITVTTGAASTPPAAPTGVKARWSAPGSPTDTLVASWKAAVAGDSPTDAYQVTIVGSDGGGTFTQSVSATALSATFTVSDQPDWSVKVRAHNAAGWGPWSATYRLGGA